MPGAYKNLQPRSWNEVHRARAMVFAGIDPTKLGGWECDFERGATSNGVTISVAGSGAGNLLAPLGGRVQLTTGATGASQARVTNLGPNLTVQPSTDKFYVAVRLRVITISDANSDNRIVAVNQTLANDHLSLQLKNNALNLLLVKGGATTTVVTSWTPETTSYHDFAIASDLVTVRAFVDGILVGSTTTLTNLDNQPCNFESNTQNGATAADQQTLLDKAVLYTQAP